MKLLSIGEVLWDVFDSQRHLGGAALNFAHHMSCLGHAVALLSGVGDDEHGAAVLDFLDQSGIDSRFIQAVPGAATGVVDVTLDPLSSQPCYRIQRPAAYDGVEIGAAELRSIAEWRPDWIYFGTLFHNLDPARLEDTLAIFGECADAGRFYDINLRPGEHTHEAVQRLVERANILKLNEEEVPEVCRILGEPFRDVEAFTHRMRARFGSWVVCVTRGADGCLLNWGGALVSCPGHAVTVADTVGAGDAFAAALLHGWSANWDPRQAGAFANSVGGLVASRPGATPFWSFDELPVIAG
jgi:fructokinase